MFLSHFPKFNFRKGTFSTVSTARVTRLGREGESTLETGKAQSQTNAEKRGAYPKSGASCVSPPLYVATTP